MFGRLVDTENPGSSRSGIVLATVARKAAATNCQRSKACILGLIVDRPCGDPHLHLPNPLRGHLKPDRALPDWLARGLADDDAIAWAQIFSPGGCGRTYPFEIGALLGNRLHL